MSLPDLQTAAIHNRLGYLGPRISRGTALAGGIMLGGAYLVTIHSGRIGRDTVSYPRYFLDQRGMTLPEILAAVAVIMIALVALASGIPIASYGIQEGRQLTTATFLANQRMEQVKATAWTGSAPPPCPLSPPAVDNLGISASTTSAPQRCDGTTTFPDENPVAAPYTQYTRQVRITDCGPPGAGCGTIIDPGLRQVTVTVSYLPMTGVGVASSGSTKSAIVTMLVARR
jgi:prepilin-type N-terminal cleavage/methylation domain-containing protein